MGETTLESKLQDEQQVKKFAKVLHSAIPLREAVQLNKRVNYFRGKKLIEACLDSHNKLDVKDEKDALRIGLALLNNGLIHASQVKDKKRRELQPIRPTTFEAEGYYTWIYEGSKTMRNLLLGCLIFSIAAMCLYPIWPQQAKMGIWYISVTFLLFFLILFTVRLIVYIVFWSIGFEFWILPNFFDEDLGVVDSFRPIISFHRAEDWGSTWYFRFAGLGLLVAFGYWCSQQPTDFDELYATQMEFLEELYNGKLLSSESLKEESLAEKAIPDVEELEKAILEEDEDDEEEVGTGDGIDQEGSESDEDQVLDEMIADEHEQEQQVVDDDDDDDEMDI